MYQTSLTWLSFASEPDEVKKTFDIGIGASSFSFSASSIAGSWLGPRRDARRAASHLLARRLDELPVRVAERRAPEARHALDVALALAVVDEDALAALEDQRPGLAEGGELGVGVDQGLDVASREIPHTGASKSLFGDVFSARDTNGKAARRVGPRCPVIDARAGEPHFGASSEERRGTVALRATVASARESCRNSSSPSFSSPSTGSFSLSELALVSARRIRLKTMAEQGRAGAAAALALSEDPGRFLSTVQIGITLVGILAGAFSGAALGERLGTFLAEAGFPPRAAQPVGYGLVIGLITYLLGRHRRTRAEAPRAAQSGGDRLRRRTPDGEGVAVGTPIVASSRRLDPAGCSGSFGASPRFKLRMSPRRR